MKEVINTFKPRVKEMCRKYSSMQLEVKDNENLIMAPCGKIGDTRHLFQFNMIFVNLRKDSENGENYDFPYMLLVSV